MLDFQDMEVTLADLEKYSKQTDAFAEDLLTTELKRTFPHKYKKALVIGRFQPLHRGHIFLIQCALVIAKSVVICIGSANKNDSDNPFSLQMRKKLLSSVLYHEKITIQKIITSQDNPNDQIWFEEIKAQTLDVDVVIGNNDWVNSIFKKAGYPIVEIPLLKREIYEGKTIRNSLRTAGKLP